MDELKPLLSAVAPPDRGAEEAAKSHWDSLAKPLGSLGLLEETVVKIAGENLSAFLEGRPIRNEVDFQSGYRKFTGQ